VATDPATPYEQHRDYVLAVLRRCCGWLGRDDYEAVFHDAYAVMLEKERDGRLDTAAMHPRQLRAYLTQTAINKALDAGKSAERTRTEPLGDSALARIDAGAAPDDLAAASLDSARLREIVSELPRRRQLIVKLRYFFDRSPADIQRLLGISERAYRRDLERALRHISTRYELVRDGRFCESRKSLVLAYVAGLSGPNRSREARDHLASCPACLRWAVDLRDTVGRAAAVLPLPALVGSGGLERLLQAAVEVRDGALHAASTGKHYAASAAARADPGMAGYASAARPSTVAAAIAGCIAVGSGATYCAVQGLPDPVRSVVAPHRTPHALKKERAAKPPAIHRAAPSSHREPATATTTVSPAPSRQPDRASDPIAQRTKTPTAQTEPHKRRPTGDEFGPEESAPGPSPTRAVSAQPSARTSTSSASSASAASTESPSGSKPPASGSGGEFDP
jgi:RNA polymerase sigma factor (sigma-70 family)